MKKVPKKNFIPLWLSGDSPGRSDGNAELF